MRLNKIVYKGKVPFDYFQIWFGEDYGVFDHETVDLNEVRSKATCVSTQVCPWCTKKYGLYAEVERSEEDITAEISFYENEDPERLDCTCGIFGCENGLADYVDLPWEDFDIEEESK